MKRVIASVSTTIVGLVMLLGFKTHSPENVVLQASSQPTTSSESSSSSESTNEKTTTTGAAVLRSPTSSARSTTTTTTTKSKTTTKPSLIDGAAATTKWGPVQVEIVVTNGKLTKVTALQYPDSTSRSVQISNRAIPQLISEALTAQSASIDGVSGASYTTKGFTTSLQSALTKANL